MILFMAKRNCRNSRRLKQKGYMKSRWKNKFNSINFSFEIFSQNRIRQKIARFHYTKIENLLQSHIISRSSHNGVLALLTILTDCLFEMNLVAKT